ncbi:hypothetical protein F7734_32380 [Scytonema sp. UIC 10036]|uniref:hypothetical protein n=1 Tax=Scytonema sp. UIC 10036 TaxID=2304196 RepID=UPI0012DA6416|nr:hypothetical protein [Scytonema sp. UIC 10036]MUG96785.1 hypothetical protein [Scytonema sp. UIC 10036]
MLNKNICQNRKTYRDLKELRESNLWWNGGNEWGSYPKKEIFHEQKQPLQQEESEFTRNKPLVLSILGIVALVSVAALAQAEKISHSLEEVRKNSVQQLLLMKDER